MKKNKPKLDAEDSYATLYTNALKLKGLAHLIETQEVNYCGPTLQKEINQGLSLMFEDIAKEVRDSTAILEKINARKGR